MNLYEAEEFFKNLHPGKKITYEFDEKCHRTVEFIYTDGLPHPFHHIECNKVRMTVEGQMPIYVPIAPHRMTTSWVEVKKYINAKSDIHISDLDLKAFVDCPPKDYDARMNEWVLWTGVTKEQIQNRVNSYKSKNPKGV